jgi:hypothetical protein
MQLRSLSSKSVIDVVNKKKSVTSTQLERNVLIDRGVSRFTVDCLLRLPWDKLRLQA